MFLYALNHLVGFENFTMEQLKGYGDAKLNGYETICTDTQRSRFQESRLPLALSAKVLQMLSA